MSSMQIGNRDPPNATVYWRAVKIEDSALNKDAYHTCGRWLSERASPLALEAASSQIDDLGYR